MKKEEEEQYAYSFRRVAFAGVVLVVVLLLAPAEEAVDPTHGLAFAGVSGALHAGRSGQSAEVTELVGRSSLPAVVTECARSLLAGDASLSVE